MKFLLKSFLILSISAASVSPSPSSRAKSLGGSGPFTFDYLLGENTNFNSPAKVIFVDYDVDKSYITKLLSAGKRVICYVNVGAYENWRSDKASFPSSVLGNDYEDWEGEKWLDIRQLDILMPIMTARFASAAKKGCEGIDPDNMNGVEVNTGFPISAQDQLAFNKAIAAEVRKAGMLAGLKNDNEQAKELEPFTDFAVVEQCARYKECGNFDAYIKNNKPVFGIEYTDYWNKNTFTATVCPLVKTTGISFILKKLDLLNNFIVSCL